MRGTLLFVTFLVVSAYSNPVNEKKRCTINSDCPKNFNCHNSECVDPCTNTGVCGIGALCKTINDYTNCLCPQGHVGNPYLECRPEEDWNEDWKVTTLPSVNLCNSACGVNTTCTPRNEEIVICTCLEGMTGDPFDFCVPIDG